MMDMDAWRREYETRPGTIEIESVADGKVLTWVGGAVAAIPFAFGDEFVSLLPLPWPITVGPVDCLHSRFYIRRHDA